MQCGMLTKLCSKKKETHLGVPAMDSYKRSGMLYISVCALDNAAEIQARTQIKNLFFQSGMKKMCF